MKPGKLFTEDELREMGRPTVELVQEAIDAGDRENSKRLARRMYNEALRQHDGYRDWITALLTFIGRRYGDQVLEEALRESCPVMLRPLAQYYQAKEGDLRGKARVLAAGLRGHLMPIMIEEDEEKFIFQMQPCGAGGRQILDGYYEPPASFFKIEKPQPMTCGQRDMPVYCAHAAIMSILSIEWTGVPILYEEPSDELGHKPCKIYIYKDPEAVPEDLYSKVGKKKQQDRPQPHSEL